MKLLDIVILAIALPEYNLARGTKKIRLNFSDFEDVVIIVDRPIVMPTIEKNLRCTD